jgi:hypothetical protein
MNKQRYCSDEIHTRNLSQINNTKWTKIPIDMLAMSLSLNSPAVRSVWLPGWLKDMKSHCGRTTLEIDKGILSSDCPMAFFQSPHSSFSAAS